MAADLLTTLLRVNLAAALAVLLVLVLRKPIRRFAGASMAYTLWLIVPVAMAGALAPPKIVTVTMAAAAPALAGIPTSVQADYSPLLLALWLAGVALSLAVLGERQRRFRLGLGRLTSTPDGILHAEGVGGPAVMGALRPRIILPGDFEDRFSQAEQRAVLAHERQHLAACHPQTNGLVAALQCLCWFNPLVWLGVNALRLDQELACDAATLCRSPSLSPRLYGEALLRTQLNAPPLPLGCHWPSSGPGPLKDRLLMLKKPTPNPKARLIGAALVAATAAIAAATAWAAQPAQVRVATELRPNQPAMPPLPDALKTVSEDCLRQKQNAPKGVAVNCTIIYKQNISARQVQPAVAPPSVTSNSVAGHRGVITPTQPAPPPKPELINDPDWVDRPTGADLARAFPERALRLEKAGQATINCAVLETGKLSGCSVVSETPEGLGFGQSALAMSGSFTMKPPSQGGSAMVNIPIKFDMR